MPAHKKDPSTRARRNRASTAATLKERPLAVALEDYATLTVAVLREEIDRRNLDGRPQVAMLSRAGRKAELVARLTGDDDPTPRLPEREGVGWHSETRRWWADVWASPMSTEWHESDVHNVLICAMVHHDMWSAPTAKERKEAAAEFRQQRMSLGLSPYDRRRLEWTIEAAGEATARGEQRRAAGQQQPPAPAGTARPDPRAGLHSVG